MGSIFAGKALYGSDAVTTNPAKSGRALGSAFLGMCAASCDFIFRTVRSSAVQDRSRHKRPRQALETAGFERRLRKMEELDANLARDRHGRSGWPSND